MSSYALENYKDRSNAKTKTEFPSYVPPKRMLEVEKPPSVVPYAMGSQVCSGVIASCRLGHGGSSSPLALSFVRQRNLLDFFNDKRRSRGSLPFVLSLPTVVFTFACLQCYCFRKYHRVKWIVLYH